ncbi:MAG: phenylacetic acid degradation protein PaaN [Sphingopyxis sp.]|nr:phenylacetic acid degradation protein PaaN [Sphingopyxis sp.]
MATRFRTGADSRLEKLIETHRATLDDAIAAVESRASWSPFADSPSTKIHGAEKPAAGKAAFEARLGRRFELDQPGIVDWIGTETSPYTREPLGITYPRSAPDALIAAAAAAMDGWRHVDPDVRIAICLEMARRIYDRNFEMAQAVMHVAGQSYVQAFSGSGPNALDRGIEALAYAAKAMRDVRPHARWTRPFGRDMVSLEKRYTVVPRGVGLVICCASFPTWNAYPAIFANLATGNAAIVKPHPIAILPMAIAVEIARETLSDHGFDPNLATLAVDSIEEPVAQAYIDDPAIQIVDFTGSPRYGSYLERTVTGKLLFTETAGLNSVVVESVEDLSQTARAIARSASLFSAQMCTSPQTIFVPSSGVRTPEGSISAVDFARVLGAEIDAIAEDAATAAGIMGAIQGDVSIDVIEALREKLPGIPGVEIVRDAVPYAHPDYPDARTMTALVAKVPADLADIYAEEQFAPVLFVVETPDADEAVKFATSLAKEKGAISSYLYSVDPEFVDASLDSYTAAGANLSVNLHGTMWINFAAAYSDYHVTGLNPAGNACLADLAFVASRFRIVQSRWPGKTA